MGLTSELRWFYPCVLPEAIAHWFETECPQQGPVQPETRDDLYLFTPDCDYLNIKWRQDRLEIKWRQAEGGEVQFGDCLSGNLETWQKCACEELTAAMPEDAETKGTWVRVRKRRSQRFYQVQDTTIEPMGGDRQGSQGCSLELTQLAIAHQPWWSLALEAYGPPDTLIHTLKATATVLSASYPREFPLTPAASFAYPHWLQQVLQGKGEG
ncbi:hypothetical protein [Laspinema olomoucense]|uniref:CYTH domain-containing protein n=1 Tax=Laspinema olomoucense D3b TaxID=2953688 RepID=A0ABT2N9N3_9CYAN|nr:MULTISPECIES: hypothetical protein [unclassified Laspinema]MCT7977976.1 hypothetical protein [Laspinema sp. D3b]MCT7987043.1 hypothetical protein [Laspinema sp. D3a]MCT7994250.1 hypothetical protein [Laspinema sp. D3c]